MNIENKTLNKFKAELLPDFELLIVPRWIFFSADDGYRRSQYAKFTLKNLDNGTIAFRFRTKDRTSMMFKPNYGFLNSNEVIEVTLVLTESDAWLQEPMYYTARIHKVIVENMRINDTNIPEGEKERKDLCREIYTSTRRKTGNRNEMNLYTKMRIVLPYHDFNNDDKENIYPL